MSSAACVVAICLLGLATALLLMASAPRFFATASTWRLSIVGALRSISLSRPIHPVQLITLAVFLALQAAASPPSR